LAFAAHHSQLADEVGRGPHPDEVINSSRPRSDIEPAQDHHQGAGKPDPTGHPRRQPMPVGRHRGPPLQVLVGLALLNGASWARWVSILFVSINVFGQLGFLGNTNDSVLLLITLTLNIIVLYALIVRWHDSQRELQTR
jgi:hypothetical protein